MCIVISDVDDIGFLIYLSVNVSQLIEMEPTESEDALNIGLVTISVVGGILLFIFISDIPTYVTQVSTYTSIHPLNNKC